MDEAPVPRFHQARDYQNEMLKMSLERNIIVAMDTGSGKTQIAIMRIAAEIERSPPGKLVWFLVPSKALAEQQRNAIVSQLPSVQCRLLTGDDNVDLWKDQWIWNAVLKDVHVVISTHAILLNALTHGFVRIGGLSMLVFDEAHSATGDHPSSRILRDFYRPMLASSPNMVPHILGLTASPVVTSTSGGIESIERTLNAVCRSPKLHRDQLLEHVHRPEMEARYFSRFARSAVPSVYLDRLTALHKTLDVTKDPYVLKLKALGVKDSHPSVTKALIRKSTFCQKTVKALTTTAQSVFDELGSWAADYYVSYCVQKILRLKIERFEFEGLKHSEKQYLQNLFSGTAWPAPRMDFVADDPRLSSKTHCLLSILHDELQAVTAFAGLIFVQTRVSVAVLAHLLSHHLQTMNRLRVATFVGSSDHALRRSLAEINDVDSQSETLNDLRIGKKNIIIATSVLEEGIDISACNVVICFEKPQNLKSFIQRRGRARQAQSKYIILFPSELSQGISARQWQALEEEMKEKYLDDMRQNEEWRITEESEGGEREHTIAQTGAKLTLYSAKPQLYKFCGMLPSTQHMDSVPEFRFEPDLMAPRRFRARIVLPSTVDPSLRTFVSAEPWLSQKMASCDAAFEACVGLLQAGLLNDHFLPLLGKDEEGVRQEIEKRANVVECSAQYDPWSRVAQEWSDLQDAWMYLIRLDSSRGASQSLEMRMVSSVELPPMENVRLHWDEELTFSLSISEPARISFCPKEAEMCAEVTKLILHSIFESRMSIDSKDFPLLFVPLSNVTESEEWLRGKTGYRKVQEEPHDPSGFANSVGIIKAPSMYGMTRYIYQGFAFHSPRKFEEDDMEVETLHFKLSRFPKRTDFLHDIPESNTVSPKKGDGISFIPVSECQVTNLPLAYSQFSALVPCLMHHVEVSLVVENLCSTILRGVVFEDRSLVKTAISASVAREPTNYQRLEFFGDSVLKFLTAVNITAEHLKWHEGYLSRNKDHIVSNGRLSRAAKESGLDKYILTKHFSGYRWAPYYNHAILAEDAPKAEPREMSTKVLADVVEALIGAAFLDGGEAKALDCLDIFLSDADWRSSAHCTEAITSTAYIKDSALSHMPSNLEHIERLIGYTFRRKILALEALTYAAYDGALPTPSYQRLEFLGDAVLDYIVTQRVFHARPAIPTPRMHLIRTALVNANFLAYLCLTLEIHVPHSDVVEDERTHTFTAVESRVARAIWQHMRHTIPEVVQAQRSTAARFEAQRERIGLALAGGARYPWSALTMLAADKFFSDLIESLLGAIFVDSGGALDACEAFLARIGLLPYLERILGADGARIQFLHPKEWLGVLAGNETVRYRVLAEEEEQARGFEAGRVTYCVSVGGRELAARSGRNAVEAETMVAEAAVEELRGEGRGEGGVEVEEESAEMRGGEQAAEEEGLMLDELVEEEMRDMAEHRLVGT